MTLRESLIPNFNSPAIQQCLAELVDPLTQLQRVSTELGMPLRVIGGLPRELMMFHVHGRSLPGARIQEVDVVVEGDARIVGRALLQRWGGTLKIHDAFLTATWHMPSAQDASLDVDLITARSETYPRPGALPVTTPGTFADDVVRRDFTVNTLALDVPACIALAAGQSDIQLFHHRQALADLEAGIIRILHDGSFRDDPTRIFRAVRYAQRYGHVIEPHSMALLQREIARSGLDNLSPVRLYHEYQRIFHEGEMMSVLAALRELQVLSHSGIPSRNWQEVATACASVARDSPFREAILWSLLLFQGAGRAEREQLRLPQKTVLAIGQFRTLVQNATVNHLHALKPSEVVQILDGVHPAVLHALVHWRPELRIPVAQYRKAWRDLRPALTGHDLIAMGYVPGAELGNALKRLRTACLDGLVTTRQEEVALIRRLLGDPEPSR